MPIANVPSVTVSLWLWNSHKTPLIHQALSGSNTSACAHFGAYCQPQQLTRMHKQRHTLMHTHVTWASTQTCSCTLLSHSFSSSHFSLHTSLVISLSAVLHANELSVLMPEHYRCVCLISLLPFLFPGDYPVFKRNRPSSHHSAPLPNSPPVGQPARKCSSFLVPAALPFTCSQLYDNWAGT